MRRVVGAVATSYCFALGDLGAQILPVFGYGTQWTFSVVSRNAAEWTGVLMSNRRYPTEHIAAVALQQQLSALGAALRSKPKRTRRPPQRKPVAKRKRR